MKKSIYSTGSYGMEVKFERQALYEEVWATPLSTLGPKYGLSDNGLRKVCKAMNIPLPAIGHWAKVRAGHTVGKPDLPTNSQHSSFSSNPPPRKTTEHHQPDDQRWLESRIAFERQPENRIVINVKPVSWHPKLIATRSHLINMVNQYAKDVKDRLAYEKRRSEKNYPGLNFDAIRWMDLDPGGLLVRRRESAGFRVSTLTYERALAIANALLFAGEARDCIVALDDGSSCLSIKFEDAEFSISIRERQDFEMVKRPPPFSSLGLERKHRPTDRLALVAKRRLGSTFELVDSAERRVEDQLNDIFVRLFRFVVLMREKAREEKAKQERQAVTRAVNENLARQRAAEIQVKADEDARKISLLEEASTWHRAQQLREFVAHVASQPDVINRPALAEWIKWAMQVAEDKDSTPGRIAALNKSE